MKTMYDQLQVKLYETRAEMGAVAAHDAAACLKALLQKQAEVRVVFAAAPSQNEFLETLCTLDGIDWSRITAFHMDEYIGLASDAQASFGQFLRERIFDRVKPGKVFYIQGNNEAAEECNRYAKLLEEAPIDCVFLGIGENGHIAFNDPPVADFRDPLKVKVVELEQACRQQQVNDGCFPSLADVPRHAITLTIPQLLSAGQLFCMVPGPTKAHAVRDTLRGPIDVACPASILRTHPACTLYLDQQSAQLLS